MSATKAGIERVARLGEDCLPNILSLAAADHLVGVPLLNVILRPSLTTVVAVCAAEHVVMVRARGPVDVRLVSLL